MSGASFIPEKELNEKDILTALYFLPNTFHSYILRLEVQFFKEKLRPFYAVLKNYYGRFGEKPARSVYEVELEGEDKDFAINLITYLEGNLDKIKSYKPDYIVEKLNVFAKKCFIKKSLITGFDLFEQQKYDKILEQFSEINDAIIEDDNGVEYHDEDVFEKRYASDVNGDVIYSGFKQIDDTVGGWHTKSLNVIAGPANSGKTMYLVSAVGNLLVEAHSLNGSKGIKILYVTLEIDEEQVGRRIDANICNKPAKDIWKNREKVRELLTCSKETLGNRVIIKDLPGYKSSPADIEAIIRNLQITSDGEMSPDIVFVDYLGLLAPTNPRKNMNTYEKGLEIAVELRGLAKKYAIPFVVAAQTNRSSFGAEVSMENISDSIGISQTADTLMTINRNEELDSQDMATLYLAKSRFCRNGLKFLMSCNYECCRIEDVNAEAPDLKDKEGEF